VHLATSMNHRNATQLLDACGLRDIASAALSAPSLSVHRGCSAEVRDHIDAFLGAQGWVSPVKIELGMGPELNALHPRCKVVLQVQTGNVARAFYDLMKMESLFTRRRAACGILAVPTSMAARVIGGNLASFDRVCEELQSLFFDQIRIPVLVAGFE
jgi:hypothetical protein